METLTFDNVDSKKFYILNHYFKERSNNIAVLGDREKYKKILDEYSTKFLTYTYVRLIRINDYKHTFIIDDMEITLVLIENTDDLMKYRLYYSKFI